MQIFDTLEFQKLCRNVGQQLGMNAGMVRAVINTALDEAERHCREGFRVDLGDRRLSLYPQVRHAVRATIDRATGEILWPRSEDVVPRREDGRLECEVHKSWNKQFRQEVHWERAHVDRRPYRQQKRKRNCP